MQTDETLVGEFRRTGDRQALDELTGRHISKVRAMVWQMVLDHSLADDLTQEIFLRAYRGLASFDGRSRFGTWLYRVALNTVYSHLSRARRSPVAFRAEVPEGTTRRAEQPDRQAMRGELSEKIEEALGTLSPRLRAAVVLTMLQGQAVAEAARVEGCTVATMYWRVHEARKQLKRQLAEYLSV